MTPAAKPKMTREEAMQLLSLFSHDRYQVHLMGIRGYYKQSMGKPDQNDRGMYDDAMFIISPEHYSTWNANTDPSRYQNGIAMLKAHARKKADGSFEILAQDPYLYKIGLHGISGPNPYEAFRQHGRVTVVRDGKGEVTDTAASPFWINIHKGGYTTTSSLGCQTIHPDQWNEFLKAGKGEMKRLDQMIIPYWLIEF